MQRYKNDIELYTRLVPVSLRKCTSMKGQNTSKLSNFLYSNYVRECTSINTRYLIHIISIVYTLYGQLKLYTIII